MEIQEQGTLVKCSFSRLDFFEIWSTANGTTKEKYQRVSAILLATFNDAENIDISALDARIYKLCKSLYGFWKIVQRNKTKLLIKYAEWLKVIERVDLRRRNVQRLTEFTTENNLPGTSRGVGVVGRPVKDFTTVNARSKRRRLARLSQVDGSAVNALRNTSDLSATSLKTNISADEVLSIFVEDKLTKHQYLLFKNFINSKTGWSILPSYQSVLNAKKKCYPNNISVSESKAEVELQSLLDHTASRILESQGNVLDSVPLDSSNNLTLIGKWGFDGSTGHSEYKQSFTDSRLDDSSLFVTSYVPLQLVANAHTDNRKVLWKNPRPSSTRYCRPIRFQFMKETTATSMEEESYYTEKISNLSLTSFTVKDRVFSIQHSLQLTMVDGKICSALNETSSARCYICKATPKEMNDIDLCLQKQCEETTFQFGLSPLHSWIRFFEYFIHLSYRIQIKKWQIRSEEDKKLLMTRKLYIQNQFRSRLGLIVDKPRSGGSGTSNDGNTARKFFTNFAISAEITELNKDLIVRCSIILQALSSGYNIHLDKFRNYALETARLLIREYPWYNLPASVHKVLIHGSKVIQNAILPIGELSEEAAESNNKIIKACRRDHTRKMSRELTNTDLINRLMVNSDPFTTSLRKLPPKKKSTYSHQVLDLCIV